MSAVKPKPLTDLERELTKIIVDLCNGRMRIDLYPIGGPYAYPISAGASSVVVAVNQFLPETIDRFTVCRLVDANPRNDMFSPTIGRPEVPDGVVRVRELAGPNMCDYRNQRFAAIVLKDAPRGLS